MADSQLPQKMLDAQVEHMVRRFLAWRLPENFTPDAGISFKPTFNDHMPYGPMKHEPVGTNLFDYCQAKAMVQHMLEGVPTPPELELLHGAMDESDDLAAELANLKTLTLNLVRAVQNELSKGTIALCNEGSWLLDDVEKACKRTEEPK